MQRRLSIFLTSFSILLTALLFSAVGVNAYEGGLITPGSVFNNASSGQSTTLLSDGDEATGITLGAANPNHYIIHWRTNSDTYAINAYQVKANNNAEFYLTVYQGTNNTPTEIKITPDGIKRNLSQTYTNVTGVGIVQRTFTNVQAYEVDVFGTLEDRTPPTVPAGLNHSTTADSVTVTWTASTDPFSGLAGYNVYRDGVKMNTSLLTQTTYTNTGLPEYKTYKYEVTSVDVAGNESAKSSFVTATTKDVTPPTVPSNVVINSLFESLELSWDASTDTGSGNVRYHVYVDGTRKTATPVAGTTYTVSGLTNDQTYSVQLSAVDQVGNESAKSAVVSGTPIGEMTVQLTPNGTSIIVKVSGGKAPYNVDWGSVTDSTYGTKESEVSTFYISGLTKSTDYTVTTTDATGKIDTQTINTGASTGYLPPEMPNSTSLYQSMVNSFGTAGTIALAVIGGAIALGGLIILGLWAWRLLKKWLATSK